MLRAQSIAVQCARELARSGTVGRAGGRACAPCQLMRCCGGSSTRLASDGGGLRSQLAEPGAGSRYHTAARSLHWNEAADSDAAGGLRYVRHLYFASAIAISPPTSIGVILLLQLFIIHTATYYELVLKYRNTSWEYVLYHTGNKKQER